MQDQVPSVGGGAGRLGRPPNPLNPAASRRADLGAEVRRLRAARGLSLNALAQLRALLVLAPVGGGERQEAAIGRPDPEP
jgi:hypothetical protein